MASVLESYARLPLRHYELRFVPTWTPDAPLWGAVPFTRALAGLARRAPWRTAIAHVHVSVRGSFVREGAITVAAAALGAPVVVSLHGGEMRDFLARHARLARGVLATADAVVTLGPTSRAIVAPYLRPRARVAVVPNPVDAPPPSGPAGAQPERVLFAAERRRMKGLDVLLDAWPAVRAARPEAILVVAGRAGDVAPAPVDGVEWVGAVPRARVAALLAGSRVAVLPSRAEVMPMVVLEAMAAARPVVATPVGELPDIVGEDGALVPVGDRAALAAALVRFLGAPDDATSAGAALRRRARERYAPERVAEQLEALYDAVTGTGDGRV
jgi:glycosyltransferase involved in cell wall biosynthesis